MLRIMGLGVIMLFFQLISCKHKEVITPQDVTAPFIQLTNPVEGGRYKSGETILIKGKVSDESLHIMEIVVTNPSSGAILFAASPYIHDLTQYEFESAYVPAAVSSEMPQQLSIRVEDHSDHVSTNKLNITILP